MDTKTHPRVSVIVPAYRSEHCLEKCLESVRHQTFSNFECIVVDDGSPDLTSAIARQFAECDSRFRAITHQTNKGVGAARNTGLRSAQGEFVLFLDGDDVLLSGALASQHLLASRHNVDAVWTTDEFWYGGDRTHRNYCNIFHYFPSIVVRGGDVRRELSLRPYRFNTPNGRLLLRREALSSSSTTFDETLVCGEDIDFVSRALRACRSAAVAPLVTLLYRKGHESLSSSRSVGRWRSFGRFQRKISEGNSDWQDFRVFFALSLLGNTAENMAAFRRQLPLQDALEIVRDITTVYLGVDVTIFDRTALHPGDVPSEWDPCFRPLFEALIRQDEVAAVHSVDELALTLFREEFLDATELRLAGDDEAADRLIVAAYEKQPWHPEFALEYGRILERERETRAKAIELFFYSYPRSVRLFEPTAALSWAIAGATLPHQESIAVVKHSLERAPHSPTLFDLLAKFYERAGEVENRLYALSQACVYAPKDPLRRERLIEGLLECSKESAANEEIDRFAPWMGEEWLERMLSLSERKNGALVTARERIDRLVQRTNECDVRALALQGDILLDLKDYTAAIHPLEIAAYHEQNSAAQRIKLATAACKAGQYEKALGVLNEIASHPQRKIDELFLELLPNVNAAGAAAFLQTRKIRLAGTPTLLSNIWKASRTCQQIDELAPAIGEALEFAAAQNPSSLFLRLVQLEFLLWKRDIRAALESASLLCSAFPQDARSHMALARCLAANQRFAEAAVAGHSACRLDPKNDSFARQADRWAAKSVGRSHGEQTKAIAE